jgi:hypothetical protein
MKTWLGERIKNFGIKAKLNVVVLNVRSHGKMFEVLEQVLSGGKKKKYEGNSKYG